MRILTVLFLSLCLGSPLWAAEPPVVNVNTADAETLSQGLKGVGPSKAAAIIEYRDTYGAFEAIEELDEVKGIGPATVAGNRDRIVLE